MAGEESTDNFESSSRAPASEQTINFNEQEKEWLVEAECQFGENKYEACLKCLQNLQASFQKNYQTSKVYTNLELKLAMNKSLCDLAISNYKNLDAFRHDLSRICSEVEIN